MFAIGVFLLSLFIALVLVSCYVSNETLATPQSQATTSTPTLRSSPTLTITPTEIPESTANFPDYDYIFIAIDNSISIRETDPDQMRFKLSQFYLAVLNLIYQKNQASSEQIDLPVIYIRIYGADSIHPQPEFFDSFKDAGIRLVELAKTIEYSSFYEDYFYGSMVEDFTTIKMKDPEAQGKLIMFTDGVWQDGHPDNFKERNGLISLFNQIQQSDQTKSIAFADIVFVNPQAIFESDLERHFWKGFQNNVNLYCLPEKGQTDGKRKSFDLDENISYLNQWIDGIAEEYGLNSEGWYLLNGNTDEIDITLPWYIQSVSTQITPVLWMDADDSAWPILGNNPNYVLKVKTDRQTETLSHLNYFPKNDADKDIYDLEWNDTENCNNEVLHIENNSQPEHSLIFLWTELYTVELNFTPELININNLNNIEFILSSTRNHTERLCNCTMLSIPYFDYDGHLLEFESDSNTLSAKITFDEEEIEKVTDYIINQTGLTSSIPPAVCITPPCDEASDIICEENSLPIVNAEDFRISFLFHPVIQDDDNFIRQTKDNDNNDIPNTYEIYAEEIIEESHEKTATYYRLTIPINNFDNSFYVDETEYEEIEGSSPWQPYITFIGSIDQKQCDYIKADISPFAVEKTRDNLKFHTFFFEINESEELLYIDFAIPDGMINANIPITNCKTIQVSWPEISDFPTYIFHINYLDIE